MKCLTIKHCLLAAVVFFTLSCQPKDRTSEQENGEENTRQPSSDMDPAAEPVPDTVLVEAKDYVFLPPHLEVKPGQNVVIKVVNNGEHTHNLQMLLNGDTVAFDEPVPVNGIGLLEFTAPQEPGTYRFYCPMRNDSMLGMKGELIVSSKE